MPDKTDAVEGQGRRKPGGSGLKSQWDWRKRELGITHFLRGSTGNTYGRQLEKWGESRREWIRGAFISFYSLFSKCLFKIFFKAALLRCNSYTIIIHPLKSIQFFAMTWMDCEGIMLSEMSQKDKYHMISLYLEPKINPQTRAHRCREETGGCQRLERVEEGGKMGEATVTNFQS